jgi:hypothetical protein
MIYVSKIISYLNKKNRLFIPMLIQKKIMLKNVQEAITATAVGSNVMGTEIGCYSTKASFCQYVVTQHRPPSFFKLFAAAFFVTKQYKREKFFLFFCLYFSSCALPERYYSRCIEIFFFSSFLSNDNNNNKYNRDRKKRRMLLSNIT